MNACRIYIFCSLSWLSHDLQDKCKNVRFLHDSSENQSFKRRLSNGCRRSHNQGKGPYYSFLLVESAYQRFHISENMLNTMLDSMVSRHEIKMLMQLSKPSFKALVKILLRCKAMSRTNLQHYGRIQSENCFLITIPVPETYFQAVKYNDNKCNVSCMS